MDEPFASLDALTRRRLGSELLNIWKTTKKVIILVTHSASEAVLLSDRVMILHGGRVRHVEHIDVPRPRTLSQKIIGEKIDFVERTLADLQTEKKSGLE
jgi:NitT/TauT family transport system ATP-binding protein